MVNRNEGFPWLSGQFEDSFSVQIFYGIVYSVNHWGWIFMVIGYAGKYLTKPNRFSKYANKAILPWYMFHQTAIVVIAWNLKPFGLHPAGEFWVILILTMLTCYLGYEIVKRFWLTRVSFGLKVDRVTS